MQPHIEQILRTLGKAFKNDEGAYENEIKNICLIIGSFVDSNIYMPIILKMMQEEDMKQQPKLLSSYLTMISHLIKQETDNLFGDNLTYIV